MTLPQDRSPLRHIPEKICVDTNVLKFVFYPPDEEKRLKDRDRDKPKNCQMLFGRVVSRELICFIPAIVLSEYITLASRLYPDKSYTRETIDFLDNETEIIWLSKELLYSIEPLLYKIRFKGVDALIAATAKYFDSTLITYDGELIDYLRRDNVAKTLNIRVMKPEDFLRGKR